MDSRFIETDRDSTWLMPPSMREWLPERHLAKFIVDAVDNLDLSSIESQYDNRGKQAYAPAMMLSLLFYGYAMGVFSSRKLEEATHDSVAFRYITAQHHPDHDTIANFRKRFLNELEGLFLQILMLARTAGFLKMGRVSLDGSKMNANASKHKALSWEYALRLEKQLKEEIGQLMAMAKAADQEGDDALDVPAEIEDREKRLQVIRTGLAEMKERAAAQARAEEDRRKESQAKKGDDTASARCERKPAPEPRAKDQVNLTDPESRIMKTKNGFEQAYNAQATVDNDSHLIVTTGVTDAGNDKRQMEPALEQLEERSEVLGKPAEILADAGYFSANNIDLCERHGITPYIALGREAHNQPLAKRLEKPPGCPPNADSVTRARHRMKTPEGKAIYAKRKGTVETVFGVIKENLGFRRFHLRGLAAANGEWTLVSLAWNLKRLHTLFQGV